MLIATLTLMLWSQTIEVRMEHWCVELHPKYTESEVLVCRAAFTIGATEGILLGSNQSNEDFEVDADGRQVVHIK